MLWTQISRNDIGNSKLSEYLYGRKLPFVYENVKSASITYWKIMTILIMYESCSLHHHECYDGSGYPGATYVLWYLLGARIFKVTDEYADSEPIFGHW